jgi:hypothetical protein
MKRLLPCFVIAAAAASFCSFLSPASASVDPTPQLAAIYRITDVAADRKDVDGCVAYHSPKFMLVDSDGTIETTDQERARLSRQFSTVGPISLTTHIDQCDFADTTATVIISQHLSTTVTDPNTNKAINVSGNVRARELWTRDGTGWKMDVAQTLTQGRLTPDQEQSQSN